MSDMQKERKIDRPTNLAKKTRQDEETGKVKKYARMILKKISSTAEFLVKHRPKLTKNKSQRTTR